MQGERLRQSCSAHTSSWPGEAAGMAAGSAQPRGRGRGWWQKVPELVGRGPCTARLALVPHRKMHRGPRRLRWDLASTPGGGRQGPTVWVVLLVHGLRGALAVAVLLTVVLLLAQVLLRRACGWDGGHSAAWTTFATTSCSPPNPALSLPRTAEACSPSSPGHYLAGMAGMAPWAAVPSCRSPDRPGPSWRWMTGPGSAGSRPAPSCSAMWPPADASWELRDMTEPSHTRRRPYPHPHTVAACPPPLPSWPQEWHLWLSGAHAQTPTVVQLLSLAREPLCEGGAAARSAMSPTPCRAWLPVGSCWAQGQRAHVGRESWVLTCLHTQHFAHAVLPTGWSLLQSRPLTVDHLPLVLALLSTRVAGLDTRMHVQHPATVPSTKQVFTMELHSSLRRPRMVLCACHTQGTLCWDQPLPRPSATHAVLPAPSTLGRLLPAGGRSVLPSPSSGPGPVCRLGSVHVPPSTPHLRDPKTAHVLPCPRIQVGTAAGYLG